VCVRTSVVNTNWSLVTGPTASLPACSCVHSTETIARGSKFADNRTHVCVCLPAVRRIVTVQLSGQSERVCSQEFWPLHYSQNENAVYRHVYWNWMLHRSVRWADWCGFGGHRYTAYCSSRLDVPDYLVWSREVNKVKWSHPACGELVPLYSISLHVHPNVTGRPGWTAGQVLSSAETFSITFLTTERLVKPVLYIH